MTLYDPVGGVPIRQGAAIERFGFRENSEGREGGRLGCVGLRRLISLPIDVY
jgi:hypothetical protein